MAGLPPVRVPVRVPVAATARRLLLLPIAAAVPLLLVTGCGSEGTAGAEAGAPPETSGSTSAAAAGDGGFCEEVSGIEEDLTLTDLSADWQGDPQGYVDRLATAAARFATVMPPEPVADAWRALGEFFTKADDALAGVDASDPEEVRAALRFDDEETFGMVLLLPGQGEAVGAFVQEECDVDLGITPPPLADVCAAVDPSHLGSVFAGTVPEGEHRRWGRGVVECVWDDREDSEVGIVVGPVDAVRPDLLQGQEPIDLVRADGGDIEVYDGAIGPLRASGGRTAATTVDGAAVLASVRTGEDGADALKAVALVGLVADGLR